MKSWVKSAMYTRMKKFIWLYELATFYDSSWGNKDPWLLDNIALDARQNAGLRLISPVPQILQEHLSNIGGLYVFIENNHYLRDIENQFQILTSEVKTDFMKPLLKF